MRRPLLLVLALLAIASVPAGAQIICLQGCPQVNNSIVPSCIMLVGHDGNGVPDPAGRFSVIVRDLANNPVPGTVVRIDLTGASELHLCSTQSPGLTVSAVPGNMWVQRPADATRTFTADLLGGSNGTGNATTPLHGGRVYANGVLIGLPTVSAVDLDGSGGVGINDLASWLFDFGTGNAYGRDDYDCSESVGINDFSMLLFSYGGAQSIASCSP